MIPTDYPRYMSRCLQLAAAGTTTTSPNPMVGAVVVARDRIIGEGFHHRAGEPHAEVNALKNISIDDEPLLKEATLFVNLEPCSHQGKTPPCADLIIAKGIRRVVIGCRDTFSKVNGRGIALLKAAGIDVIEGVMAEESKAINRKFFTFHNLHRPFITLKWAQSADGFIDKDHCAVPFSSAYTQTMVHKLRAEHDAILVGRTTAERDKPRLDVRHWAGKSPRRFVLSSETTIESIISQCRQDNLLSLLVEGGRQTLEAFIGRDLFDTIRIETAPMTVGSGTPAPALPDGLRMTSRTIADNRLIETFQR